VVNEVAFKAVAVGLEEQELWQAVKIFQLDDWYMLLARTRRYNTRTNQPAQLCRWYGGRGSIYSNCVNEWSLPARTFPSGLKNLSAALGTPWLLYVPFWCPENTYKDKFRWLHSYNPDHPELVIAEPHPDDSLAFYRMLFDKGTKNGMAGFENDYLDYNFLSFPYLRKTHGAANKWLAGMNTAALERGIPVQLCMALPSDLMASVAFNSMTNYRASTDYGIDDSSMPLQPNDDNFNIGSSSLIGFALDLRPSKDISWTGRPQNCRGDPTADPKACGRWGAHTNPGSNCELNLLVATLSTGPVSIADKASDSNKTLIRRCVRADGRILQPDKPATAVDSMFAVAQGKFEGQVWATSTTLGRVEAGSTAVWHYVLSVDVTTAWKIHGTDFYPKMPSMPSSVGGWVAHQWFSGHGPTACLHGSKALASRCLSASIRTAKDIPAVHNRRPVMVKNDTRMFDLMLLAPVMHGGWVLLGEVDRYVSVSRDRFEAASFSASGINATLRGAAGETAVVTALQPTAATAASAPDWLIHVKSVKFGKSGREVVSFTRQIK
jgi:hypothetical protein